ncbi:MAG: hypothetical protein FMNOHCHN_03646 [Ignavibacteriaceae bacterium]|nr:hypothetical protein [Ignavibacteriaceae bacterium]
MFSIFSAQKKTEREIIDLAYDVIENVPDEKLKQVFDFTFKRYALKPEILQEIRSLIVKINAFIWVELNLSKPGFFNDWYAVLIDRTTAGQKRAIFMIIAVELRKKSEAEFNNLIAYAKVHERKYVEETYKR